MSPDPEHSRVQSVPSSRGKLGRIPRISLGYRSLTNSMRIRETNINSRPNIEIYNSENNISVPAKSNSVISILPEINGDKIKNVV